MTDPNTPKRPEKPSFRFVADGQEYASVEDMPPEVRRVWEETQEALRSVGRDPDTKSRRFPGGAIVSSHDTRITRSEEPPDPNAPKEGVQVHHMRIESEVHLGGQRQRPRRTPLWVNVLVLVICAAILVAIWMAY